MLSRWNQLLECSRSTFVMRLSVNVKVSRRRFEHVVGPYHRIILKNAQPLGQISELESSPMQLPRDLSHRKVLTRTFPESPFCVLYAPLGSEKTLGQFIAGCVC